MLAASHRLDRGRFVVVRGAVYPAATARAYEVDLREMGVTLWRAIDRDLKPAYESRTDSERVDEDKTGGVLIDIGALLESQHGDGWAKKAARKAAGQADAHNERGTYGPIKALGIDVVRSQGFKGPILDRWIAGNSTLIKSVRESAIPGLRKDIEEAFASGLRWEDLRDKWVKEGLPLEFGTLEGRAKVIARTELGKLNAELTEARQRDLGVTHFMWRTSGDLRVRDDHRARNGKRYEWDKADKKPGHDPNCRCTAEAVLDLDVIEPASTKPFAQPGQVIAAKKAAKAKVSAAAKEAQAAAKAQAKAQAAAAAAAKKLAAQVKASELAAKKAAKAQAAAQKKLEAEAKAAAKAAAAAQAEARKRAEEAAAAVRAAAPALPQPRAVDPLERDVRVPATEAEAVRFANERVRETAIWENSPNPKLARIAEAAKFERDLLEEVLRDGEVYGKLSEYGSDQVKDRAEFFAAYLEARKIEATLPTGSIVPRGAAHSSKGLSPVVKGWVDSLPKESVESFRDWSGEHYPAMRGIDSQWVTPDVKRARHEYAAYRLRIARIRQAMQLAPAHTGKVYRGLSMHWDPNGQFAKDLRTPGALIDQPSIASWSHSEMAARGFAHEGNDSYVIETITKRGVNIDNDHTSEFGDSEGEVLLDRGRFRVMSSTFDPSIRAWRVVLEEA